LTKGFVVLIIGNSKSNHVGAQVISNPPSSPLCLFTGALTAKGVQASTSVLIYIVPPLSSPDVSIYKRTDSDRGSGVDLCFNLYSPFTIPSPCVYSQAHTRQTGSRRHRVFQFTQYLHDPFPMCLFTSPPAATGVQASTSVLIYIVPPRSLPHVSIHRRPGSDRGPGVNFRFNWKQGSQRQLQKDPLQQGSRAMNTATIRFVYTAVEKDYLIAHRWHISHFFN